VPIGGASGAFTPEALFRLMTGFLRGLQDADKDHHFRDITICETDRARFRAIQTEFYRLCGTKLFDGVEVTLHEAELAPAPEPGTRFEAVPQAPQKCVSDRARRNKVGQRDNRIWLFGVDSRLHGCGVQSSPANRQEGSR